MTPRPLIDPGMAYRRTPIPSGIRLRLDANEGTPVAALDRDAIAVETLRRYPDARWLEAQLAGHFGVDASEVFVSAGADDVIDRSCRAFLASRNTLLVAEPTFEMFSRYASLCGATVVGVPWAPGRYPVGEMLARVDGTVSVIAIVTPNNPTGEVVGRDDLLRLAEAAPDALVIVDHAYVEFADEDLTEAARGLPNVIVLRTFSKAWGLAGCRVGYALGPATLLSALRAAGGPFPVAAPSLAIAGRALEQGVAARSAYVARARIEREQLYHQLTRLGGRPRRSEANFVFAELGADAPRVRDALVANGVLVRHISDRSGASLGLRISLPGDVESFEFLTQAIAASLGGAS